MRILPLFACCIALAITVPGASAAAQQPAGASTAMTPERWTNASPSERSAMVDELAGTCDFRDRRARIGVPAGGFTDFMIVNSYLRLLSRMLERDLPECPAAAAIAFTRAAIGAPERADVDLGLLELGWRAAEQGQGMAADPALADRYGRMLWLFHDGSLDLPRWPEAERQAWLIRPETVALLRAHVLNGERPTRRASELLTGLLLSRDFPGYDPPRALVLIERAGDRLRISRLLSDGEHFPPDYARAADTLIVDSHGSAIELPYRGQLLNIGLLAAEGARTPAEQAQALRSLSAATLDEYFSTSDGVDALVRGIGRVPVTELAPADAALVARTIETQLQDRLPPRRRSEAGLRPTLLRALIGPDGRIVTTEIAGSSGVAWVDYSVRAAWLPFGAELDLSETARGRFVWADFPPIEHPAP
jgi:hypothetical protein